MSEQATEAPPSPSDVPHGKSWGIGFVGYGLSVGVVCSLAFSAIAMFAVSGSVGSDPQVLAANPVVIVAGMLGLWVGFLGAPLAASFGRGARSLATDFWFRFDWRRDIALGLGIGLALRLAGVGFGYIAHLVGIPLEEMSNSQFMHGHGLLAMVVLAVCVALGAPVVEELFFRGLTLQAFMRRYGAVVGVVVSSLLFGMMHFQGFTLGAAYIVLVTAFSGAVFAVVTLRTRRMGAGVIAHAVYNSTAVVLLLLGVS